MLLYVLPHDNPALMVELSRNGRVAHTGVSFRGTL